MSASKHRPGARPMSLSPAWHSVLVDQRSSSFSAEPAAAAHCNLYDRESWDLDFRLLHLNHGSFGAVTRTVSAEQRRWSRLVEANPAGFFARDLAEHMAVVRERVAAFVGADASGVVLQPNVTFAVAGVLASVPLERGDEVLVTDDTYPAVRAAAAAACERTGAVLREARLEHAEFAAESISDAIEHHLSERTRLVVVDHITSATALLVDIEPLIRRCHDHGAAVLVDGAHAPGLIDLGVARYGADFYTGNFHKWCCAPRGSAFLAVAPAWRERLRTVVAGSKSDDPFPERFEWWGTSDYTAVLATPSALDLLQDADLTQLRSRNARIVHDGALVLSTALEVAAPPSSDLAMVSLVLPDWIARRAERAESLRRMIARECRAEVMAAEVRGRLVMRLSAHAYNRVEDFETFAHGLGSAALNPRTQ